MKKITILIADDHKLIRDTWAFMLNSHENFTVIAVAASGHEAIELAKTNRPDVVLMDINLGDLSGFEATKMIRKYSPGSRIIGVSMHTMPAYVKKMFSMGATGYVTKNSTREEFTRAILEVKDGRTYICEEVRNIIIQQEMEAEPNHPDINNLSRRELEVAQFIKGGLSSREIAVQMGVTLKTIEVHRYNILKKLTLPNSAALVNFINANGF